LIQAFINALKRLGIKGTVITTDMSRLSPGLYFGNKHYIVPLTTDPEYIPIIKSICFKERIQLLIPTIDDELPLFGKYRNDFQAVGIHVAVSSLQTGEICNDKYKSANFLLNKGLPFAASWLPEELDFAKLEYPLFLKPRNGRGRGSAYTINNGDELNFFLKYVEHPVVQEYLNGKEYTIDLLADFDGQIISAVPRERMVIRSGVTDRGKTLNHPAMIKVAVRTAEALDIRGPANIQIKLHNDVPTVFEVNPRFSGGIPLTIAAGADFPAWLIKMSCGQKVHPCIGKFTDKLIMTCYESAIFLQDDAASEGKAAAVARSRKYGGVLV